MSKKDQADYQVDFLPFANSDTSNVIDQATYSSLPTRGTGFVSGVAQSAQLNKVWRQSSIMAAALATFISNFSKSDVIDDGNVAGLADKFAQSIQNSAGGVKTFNDRTGAVTLNSGDVTGALGFTPPTPTGGGASGNWNVNSTGLVTPNFSIVEEGGKLMFKHQGTNIASMDESGNITTLANVTAFSPSV